MIRSRALRLIGTAAILALFCLFSFGTMRLRARLHQQRSHSLVSVDGGDRTAVAVAVVQPAPPAAAALVLLPAPALPFPPADAAPVPRLEAVASPPILRGPPVLGA